MKTTSSAPERIVAFSMEGCGKTRAWASTAEAYRTTETPGTFYVVNTEPGAVDRLSDGFENFASNVEWTDVRDWLSLRAATTEYLSKVQAGDWVVLENAGRPWAWVQDAYEAHYAKQQGYHEEDLFAVVPVDESPGKWPKINAEYFRWQAPLTDPQSNPAHLFITSEQTSLVIPTGKRGEWADSKENVSLYQRIGVRPVGQKGLSHQVHTVLHLDNPRFGDYVYTSVKDRERELAEGEPILTFPASYLVPKGGWEW